LIWAIRINSELHDKSFKSGDAPTPEAARVRVIWIVDQALARAAQTFRTKKSPVQSGGNGQGIKGNAPSRANAALLSFRHIRWMHTDRRMNLTTRRFGSGINGECAYH
jgi:hypothetical protein